MHFSWFLLAMSSGLALASPIDSNEIRSTNLLDKRQCPCDCVSLRPLRIVTIIQFPFHIRKVWSRWRLLLREEPYDLWRPLSQLPNLWLCSVPELLQEEDVRVYCVFLYLHIIY